METTLSQFKTNNLEIKLTNDKLFINTFTSNEAFALRSVNGIGVIDHVDDYNDKMILWKKGNQNLRISYVILGIGSIFMLVSIVLLSLDFIPISIIFLIIGFYVYSRAKKNKKPTLMSAVRIMMSGGNRDFLFDKTGVGSGTVSEFVAQVESTLTSYHKNQD